VVWKPVAGDERARRAAFAQAMQRLESRITRFVHLSLAILDRVTLQRRLVAIGTESDPAVLP